jgi:hypothetical protein
MRAAQTGKSSLQDSNNLGCMVGGQRSLGNVRKTIRTINLNALRLCLIFDNYDLSATCTYIVTDGPDDLWVVTVTDYENCAAPLRILGYFMMDLRHKRTGGIHDSQVPFAGFVESRRCNPVGTENDRSAEWDILDVFDKHRATRP